MTEVDEDEEMAVVSHSVSSGPGEYTALSNLPDAAGSDGHTAGR